ncbi:MAG: hypothetical protein HY360_06290 [Verrucomicrobia bacterium]|nr:hypothetical protein [Verrucomicrobiota bacterium]
MTRTIGEVRAFALFSLFLLATASAPAADDFRLQDFLGRAWRNECVAFPLDGAQLKAATSGRALVGTDGKPVLYQILPGPSKGDPRSIAFLADLDSFERRAYSFTNVAAKVQTDLRIEEDDACIRLANSRTAIALKKKWSDAAGPIDSLRLASGKWVGGSRCVVTNQSLTSYTIEVVARGPVLAEAVCRATFGGTNSWQMRVRVQANEPVVLVDESFALGDQSWFVLNLGRNFSPDNLLYRVGKHRPPGNAIPFGAHETWKLSANKSEPVFVLEPWLHWSQRERQGVWFGLYNESGADLLAIGAREAAAWVDPARPRDSQSPTQIPVVQTEHGPEMSFPLKHGCRKWLIATLEKDSCLAALKKPDDGAALLPQQCLIKHGDFPLNLVKDYVLCWEGERDNHPHLMLTKKDVARYRESLSNRAEIERQIPGLLKGSMRDSAAEQRIAAFFATGHAGLGGMLTEAAVERLQERVDIYLKNGALSSAPPIHSPTAITLADAVLSSDQLSAELRKRLLAQAAFLGYTLDRPDLWSPERGFAANPNMTSSIYGSKAMVAYFIPSHPLAKQWVKDALAELKDNQLDRWTDANGGCLESPHYAMCSYDQFLATFLMTHNAGFADHLYHPKMKKVIEWFGKISTPPDSRIGGFRHLPPIGNTWSNEPTGEFGIIAYLWRDRDPEFAAQMQWMWKQHRSYPEPGIGGSYPALAGYRSLLRDPMLPEKPPPWKSELFPETGVILRNKFPCDRETQLHMIAGKNHAHYDMDSGSITLWGKGRILADEFGYYGCVTGDEHSMVTTPVSNMAGTMKIIAFAPSDAVDYVKGVKNGWTRQIAFLKEPDPLGANYFVLCDSIATATNATWRLWMTAKQVTARPQGAVVEGKEDVDMDIFFARPSSVNLKTEELTRQVGCGMLPNGSWGPSSSTQIGLIAAVAPDAYNVEHEIVMEDPVPYFVTVLYPRLKTEKAPVISSIASGKGVKIESTNGTDYVFLSPHRFSFKEGDIAFEGTVGTIQLRGARSFLALGAAGRISSREQTLQSDKAATKVIAW